ncbi:MAG: YgfZ/GcvT domain-containing protein [Gemmatimonas sp.]
MNSSPDSPPVAAPPPANVERAPAITLSDAERQTHALLGTGAVYFDLAPRHISTFTGEKAADSLNGLISNDVLPLAVGKGMYAAALTPKGKMLADVHVLRTEPQTFVVESTEASGREWFAMVRKYVNPRLAKYKDDSTTYATIGLYGANAAALLARLGTGGFGDQDITDAMAAGLESWPNWSHAAFVVSGTAVRLVRLPHLGAVPGFEILAPAEAKDVVLQNLERVGAVRGSRPLWDLAALEGALPLQGLDMDANTIPQEANLDDWSAISYEKGCYTGQETVARLHFRGHVNKLLRGLRSEQVLTPGQPVYDGAGKQVGDVRRSGHSPRLGPIAIAMVRREVAPGAQVRVGSADEGVSATVAVLPTLGAAGW